MDILIKNKTCFTDLYAVEDMRYLLRAMPYVSDAYFNDTLLSACSPDFEIQLTEDSSLESGAWSVCFSDGCACVSASSADGLSCGIYDMLEKIGFRFEVTGPVIPENDTISSVVFDANPTKVNPVLKKRGIRQHINFPMDISSCTLSEAKKYIRNLARMKFNTIVYHSYGGQWCCVSEKGQTAGHFFYGCPHTIPGNALLKEKIRNEEIFCMPEAEPYFNDAQKNSDVAKFWLRELIKESVHVGLRVEFSYEAAQYSEDALPVAREILSDYPGISTLELVTMEMCGEEGFNKLDISRERLTERIKEIFGEDCLTAECEERIAECTRYDKAFGAFKYVEANLKAMDQLSQEYPDIQLRLGIYVPDSIVLNVLYPVLEKNVSEKYEISYLPNYGSKGSFENIDKMSAGHPDTKRTTYYSWAECDGDMYVIQNHCRGLYDLVTLLKNSSDDRHSHEVCVNHWRNAENAVTIRYFADCAIDPSAGPAEYYKNCAVYYGISDPDGFAEAEEALNTASLATRVCAFCYVGCWFTEPEESARPGQLWSREGNLKGRARYQNCLDMFKSLYDSSSEKGKRFLALTVNRIETTLLHYDSWIELTAIEDLISPYSKKSELSEEICAEIKKCADRAMIYAKKYMIKHCEIMPDRGAEGNLSSYYKTMIYYIDHIKRKYSGIPLPDLYESVPLNPPPAPGER